MSDYKCSSCNYIGDYWDFFIDESMDGDEVVHQLKCPKCGNFAGEGEDDSELFIEQNP